MSKFSSHTSSTCQAVNPASVLSGPEGEEERVVAELRLLGIRHVSRRTSARAKRVRPPDALLADLVRQPSVYVRAAVFAVLLAHPKYAAAVLLQQEHAERLRCFVADQRLPDQYSAELGLPKFPSLHERLIALGRQRRRQTQACINWAGTHERDAAPAVLVGTGGAVGAVTVENLRYPWGACETSIRAPRHSTCLAGAHYAQWATHE